MPHRERLLRQITTYVCVAAWRRSRIAKVWQKLPRQPGRLPAGRTFAPNRAAAPGTGRNGLSAFIRPDSHGWSRPRPERAAIAAAGQAAAATIRQNLRKHRHVRKLLADIGKHARSSQPCRQRKQFALAKWRALSHFPQDITDRGFRSVPWAGAQGFVPGSSNGSRALF